MYYRKIESDKKAHAEHIAALKAAARKRLDDNRARKSHK